MLIYLCCKPSFAEDPLPFIGIYRAHSRFASCEHTSYNEYLNTILRQKRAGPYEVQEYSSLSLSLSK